jgi:hypothetical protein
MFYDVLEIPLSLFVQDDLDFFSFVHQDQIFIGLLAASEESFSSIEIIYIIAVFEYLFEKIIRHHAMLFSDDTIKIADEIILDGLQFFKGESFIHDIMKE